MDLIYSPAEIKQLPLRQHTISACQNHMHIFRKLSCQATQKLCSAAIFQQMKIIQKQIPDLFSSQSVAQFLHQKCRARGIIWALILPQEIQPCRCKTILNTSPENCEILRIDTDPDYPHLPGIRSFFPLSQQPAHCRRLAIAHRCNDCRERTAECLQQTSLQTF